jgi:hypothetical protein
MGFASASADGIGVAHGPTGSPRRALPSASLKRNPKAIRLHCLAIGGVLIFYQEHNCFIRRIAMSSVKRISRVFIFYQINQVYQYLSNTLSIGIGLLISYYFTSGD